ncbi:ATP-binding protein, partial [Phytoactinopolyspora endophytica]|uniref:ATP-binding protein n=1 Tax=Phytoactinopolyspora endophytica TaxID=1642495 RepID=UPI00197B519A
AHADTGHHEGSGLGLAIVRAIAEAHQGRATVRSTVGHGSVFAIELPVTSLVSLESDETTETTP